MNMGGGGGFPGGFGINMEDLLNMGFGGFGGGGGAGGFGGQQRGQRRTGQAGGGRTFTFSFGGGGGGRPRGGGFDM